MPPVKSYTVVNPSDFTLQTASDVINSGGANISVNGLKYKINSVKQGITIRPEDDFFQSLRARWKSSEEQKRVDTALGSVMQTMLNAKSIREGSGELYLPGGTRLCLTQSAYPNRLSVNGNNSILLDRSLITMDISGGGVKFKSEPQSAAFEKFINKWDRDELKLHRGLSSFHFSWDDMIKEKKLRSEGSHDIPSFTMAGEGTRWLPSFMLGNESDIGVSAGIARGGSGHTDSVSRSQGALLGVVVEFDIGKSKNIPVCYLSESEQVVQGPLKEGEGFTISHLVTVSEVITFKGSCENLPLASPYVSIKDTEAEVKIKEEIGSNWAVNSSVIIDDLRSRGFLEESGV